MNYTLHQLNIFLEVVKQESITRAAEALNMTQPALSIQLKNFQQQFEYSLTEIVGKKLYVTDFGKSIASLAENVLKEAEAIQYKTNEYKGLLTGKLRISSASTGQYVLPYFLNGFFRQHNSIDLELDVTNKASVIRSLRDNKVDFAFVSVLPSEVAVKEEIVLPNRLYLVGSSDWYDNRLPLVFREKGSATRAAMDQYYGKVVSRKRIELTSNEAVKQAIVAGLGYSILPLVSLRNEIRYNQLFIIPAPSLPITTAWRLVWLHDKKLSAVAQAYLNYLRLNKTEIVQREFQWYIDFKV